MVKLGKAYENLMVDLRPGSVKLRDRARRIIAAATGAGPDHASQALADSQGEVKTAIVMLARGVDAARGRARCWSRPAATSAVRCDCAFRQTAG